MDIAAASDITTSRIQAEIATKVAKKTQDVTKEQGEAAIALLKSAAENAPAVSEDGHVDTVA